jgi:hypothetical protein
MLLTGSVWGQDKAAPTPKSDNPPKAAAAPAQTAAPAAGAPVQAAPAAAAPGPMQARGPTRIDFDDRLLQGQTNKLGAVYLYQRKAPAQPSLLTRRTSFRDEIARDLLE